MSVVSVATLQDLIDGGYALTAYHQRACPQCTHSAELDLLALRDKYGPDFSIIEHRDWFVSRMRCERCGTIGSGMGILLSPPRR